MGGRCRSAVAGGVEVASRSRGERKTSKNGGPDMQICCTCAVKQRKVKNHEKVMYCRSKSWFSRFALRMIFESLPGALQVLLERLFRSTWSLWGASWSQLGASWAPLGANLEPLGGLLEPTWSQLGASWVQLGASWAPLGSNLAPLGGLLSSTWRFGVPFGCNLKPLGCLLDASWAQLRALGRLL